MHFGNPTAPRIEVKSLAFKKIQGQEKQYQHNYVVNPTGDNINRLTEIVKTLSKAGDDLAVEKRVGLSDVDGFAKVISETVTLGTERGQEVKIQGGWENIRYGFVLRVEVTVHHSSPMQYIVQGYTDRPELTDDTNLIINGISVYGERHYTTTEGVERTVMLLNSSNVFPKDEPGEYRTLLRPSEVFSKRQCEAIQAYFTDGIVDTRIHTDITKISNRAMMMPIFYIEKIIDSMTYAVVLRSCEAGSDICLYAAEYARDCDLPLGSMRYFKPEATSLERYPEQIGLKELKNRWRSFDVSVEEAKASDNAKQFSNNGELSVSAHIARQVSKSLQYYMACAGVSSMEITVNTSDNALYPVDIRTFGSYFPDASIVTGDFERSVCFTNYNELVEHFKNNVVIPITFGNQLPIKLSVFADSFGESIIDVIVQGEEPKSYRFPTFADSLTLPFVFEEGKCDEFMVGMNLLIDAAVEVAESSESDSSSSSVPY